jgi:hypothetical protein
MRIIRMAEREYPRYIAEKREGRLKGQYPREIGMIPSLRRKWDAGGFGSGTRLTEAEAESPARLFEEMRSRGMDPQHDEVEFYEVRAPNSPRVRIPRQRLFEMARRPPTEG